MPLKTLIAVTGWSLNRLSFILSQARKGPVKLIQRVKVAHSFLQSISSLVLHMTVKEFFRPHPQKTEK